MKESVHSEWNTFARHAQNTFSLVSLQKCLTVENILLQFIIIFFTKYWGGPEYIHPPISKCVGGLTP